MANTDVLSIQLYTLRSLGGLDRVLDAVNQWVGANTRGEEAFTSSEGEGCLREMEEKNQVM